LAYRELDAALGLTELGENLLNDWRTGKNTQYTMVALMRHQDEDRHIKTPAVSLRGVEKRVIRHKGQRSAPFARENRG
jgi:hypothetical protein